MPDSMPPMFHRDSSKQQVLLHIFEQSMHAGLDLSRQSPRETFGGLTLTRVTFLLVLFAFHLTAFQQILWAVFVSV